MVDFDFRLYILLAQKGNDQLLHFFPAFYVQKGILLVAIAGTVSNSGVRLCDGRITSLHFIMIYKILSAYFYTYICDECNYIFDQPAYTDY